MKESYGEGVATHTGPESCGAARKVPDEALTGVHVGRVLSREIVLTPGCRCSGTRQKATSATSISREGAGPRAVVDPEHAWKHLERESGDPRTACRQRVPTGRIGKSKDATR
jgi:hypothetical protein